MQGLVWIEKADKICSLLQQWLQNNFYTWFTGSFDLASLLFTEFKRTVLH